MCQYLICSLFQFEAQSTKEDNSESTKITEVDASDNWLTAQLTGITFPPTQPTHTSYITHATMLPRLELEERSIDVPVLK